LMGDVYKRQTNSGASWTAVNNGLTSNKVWSLAVSDSNIFVGTATGGVFRLTVNDTNWTAVNTGITNSSVYSLVVSGSNIFAGTGGGVFLSTNSGTSWTAVNTGLTNTLITALAVSDANLFAGTAGGGIFLSTNNGTSWTAVNTGITSNYVYAFAVSDRNVFAGTSTKGIFLSTNNGTNWTDVNQGLTVINVRSLTVLGTNLFAGTYSGGVWRRSLYEMIPVELTSFTANVNGIDVILNWTTATETNNQGFEIERQVDNRQYSAASWEKIGYVAGFGTTTETKSYSYTDDNISAGKYVYRLKQIDYDGTFEYSNEIEVEIGLTPSEFALEQNYPNPFNPNTVIKYSILEEGFVTLEVYNLLGEKVASLVNEMQEAGRYDINFDASNLSSGIYVYSLRSGKFTSVKKMLLLR